MCISDSDRGVHLGSLLEELGRRGITSLLVEGGGGTLGGFIEAGLADAFFFFYAPKILGDEAGVPLAAGRTVYEMKAAEKVYDVRVRRFREDIMISGRFREDLY